MRAMEKSKSEFLDMIHYWNERSRYSTEEENLLYEEMLDRLSAQLDLNIFEEENAGDGLYRIHYPIFF